MEQKTPHVNYYEGILQLRNPTSDTIDFIFNRTEKQKKEWVRISRTKKVKGGVDFHLTSKKYMRALGKQLQTHFGGELKESAQLYSRNHQTGKNIYRLNVLFRPSKYKIGDIILHKEVPHKVRSLNKKISATNLKTKKKSILKYENQEILKIRKTIISKVKPDLEVLDPDTYQSTKPENKIKAKHGEKVKVVKYNEAIYFV